MKKINTILAALSALLMLTVTSANSIEFKAGVSANGMAAYANASETLKDTSELTNEEAVLATSFASIFAEVSGDDMMGIGIGISYAPEVVELNKETRNIQQAVSGEGDSGAQIIDGKVVDLMSIYLTLPIGDSGAFVKAGYNQATLNTEENLATGSSYENIDLTGTQIGAGYEGSLGDMAFWRAEGALQMWDDISATGSEAGGTASSRNRIEAELGSVTGALSVGMKF
ncbi:hypothetical protein OAQ59_02365 [Candidatus Pelagibacter sp.]|jgi:hypothetical protein|nr:hypothetical protein [Candidatus Pelagibacter sp.]